MVEMQSSCKIFSELPENEKRPQMRSYQGFHDFRSWAIEFQGCRWWESNPHGGLPHTILSRARLPIPPHRRDNQHFTKLSFNCQHFFYSLSLDMEAAPGFEPGIKVLQTSALPLGYAALIKSGRRDSNPRPPPWQGGVLPLNYFRIRGWGSWIRTNASRSQSPLPYRLAIPQRCK